MKVKLGMEKWKYAGESLGISIGKIWYRKKYHYRYRKNSVPEKVSISVLVNILGTVTHWLMLVGARSRDAYTSEKESES